MKNIATITLLILGILLIGVLVKNYMASDIEKLPTYLPQKIETTQNLTLFQTNPIPSAKTVSIGPNVDEEVAFDVISTQGQYLSEERKLALTVSVEEVNASDYELYKEKIWQRYTASSRGGISSQEVIRDHDVYLSFREVADNDDTSTMVVMGGGYVFFPENSVVVAYSLYNPRLSACDDIWKPETCTYTEDNTLPTITDAENIARQILDQYLVTEEL
jgi:hypothetical protein